MEFRNHRSTDDEAYKAKKRAYAAVYRAENREKIKIRKAASNKKHPEKSRARKAAWKANNPDKIKRSSALYYRSNKNRIESRNLKWAAENPSRIAIHAATYRMAHPEKASANSAKRRGLKHVVSARDLRSISIWEKGWRTKNLVPCYWCGVKTPGKKCHLDHIIPISKDGPHSIENLCISCAPCNRRKHAKPIELWNASLLSPVLL